MSENFATHCQSKKVLSWWAQTEAESKVICEQRRRRKRRYQRHIEHQYDVEHVVVDGVVVDSGDVVDSGHVVECVVRKSVYNCCVQRQRRTQESFFDRNESVFEEEGDLCMWIVVIKNVAHVH